MKKTLTNKNNLSIGVQEVDSLYVTKTFKFEYYTNKKKQEATVSPYFCKGTNEWSLFLEVLKKVRDLYFFHVYMGKKTPTQRSCAVNRKKKKKVYVPKRIVHEIKTFVAELTKEGLLTPYHKLGAYEVIGNFSKDFWFKYESDLIFRCCAINVTRSGFNKEANKIEERTKKQYKESLEDMPHALQGLVKTKKMSYVAARKLTEYWVSDSLWRLKKEVTQYEKDTIRTLVIKFCSTAPKWARESTKNVEAYLGMDKFLSKYEDSFNKKPHKKFLNKSKKASLLVYNRGARPLICVLEKLKSIGSHVPETIEGIAAAHDDSMDVKSDLHKIFRKRGSAIVEPILSNEALFEYLPEVEGIKSVKIQTGADLIEFKKNLSFISVLEKIIGFVVCFNSGEEVCVYCAYGGRTGALITPSDPKNLTLEIVKKWKDPLCRLLDETEFHVTGLKEEPVQFNYK